MAATAAHLRDCVFPDVPVRQWVLTLPFAARYRLAFDAPLLREAAHLFARSVFGWLRAQARDCGIFRGQCGAVTFVQRFSSDLRLNPHFHMVSIQAVYSSVSTPWSPTNFPRGAAPSATAQLLKIRPKRPAST
jgi:hypothetical protein